MSDTVVVTQLDRYAVEVTSSSLVGPEGRHITGLSYNSAGVLTATTSYGSPITATPSGLTLTGLLGAGMTPNLSQVEIKQTTTYALSINNNAATQNYAVRIDGTTSNALVVGSRTTSTDLLWITATGSVGVGVVPTNKLDVNGAVGLWSGGQNYAFLFNSAGALDIQAGSNATAGVRIGTSVATPVLFYTNGTERVRIDANGNVGVGATPVAKLHVTSSDWGPYHFGVSGTTKGLRVSTNSAGVLIQGVDQTLSASYQPVTLGGSAVKLGTPGSEELLVTGGYVVATNSGGVGYGANSGGVITQLTSKSTTVTLARPSGQITMHNQALASGATVSFTLSLGATFVDAYTTCIVTPTSSTNQVNYNMWVANNGGGSFQVYLRNISAGSLSEAVVFNFAVVRASSV